MKFLLTNTGIYFYKFRARREIEGDILIAIIQMKESFQRKDYYDSDYGSIIKYAKDLDQIEEITLL